MAELNKNWGGNPSTGTLNVQYTGSKDGTAVHSSSTNESIDREISMTLAGTGALAGQQVVYKVVQEGKREVFNAADGPFILADGDTFNVLKPGMTP